MSRKHLMRLQRLVGITFIAISVAIVMMAQRATNIIDSDILPVFFMLPAGVYWTFTKKLCIEL